MLKDTTSPTVKPWGRGSGLNVTGSISQGNHRTAKFRLHMGPNHQCPHYSAQGKTQANLFPYVLLRESKYELSSVTGVQERCLALLQF